MFRLVCLCLSCLLLLGIASVWADPVRPVVPGATGPTTTLTPIQIEQLITQLGDKQFAKRKAAKDTLEQLGPVALPYLQAALNKEKDPEVRRQLQSLVPSLEQMAALTPTLLTITCKDKPLTEVLKEIEKQSKYKIELVNGKADKATVSINWEKLSFWKAMQSLCEQQGLMFQEGWYGNDNVTVRLMPGESNHSYLHVDGPFRVSATGFYYNRSVQFGNRANQANVASATTESLQVNMTVTVEPKMPLLMVKQPVFTEAISDTNDNLMLPINPSRNQYYQHGYRSYMHQITGQLKPTSGGHRVKSLKGTIPVTVVAQTKPIITIEKLSESKGKTFKSGTSTIRIDDLTTENGQQGIKMSITDSAASGPNDYSWMNSIQQRIEVYDDKGNKLQHYGGSWGMNGNNNINGTFHFSGAPAKLVYLDWITLNYQIPFSFEELPLP
ncbi:MAG TPA: HEAT repeat domain-containing protein [Gemmatales bacterium]|nr:HEAT repeat domain-containing protein [Gemmatales bacterium]